MRTFRADDRLTQPKNPGFWGMRPGVTAESMRQALGMLEDRYPQADSRVVFPPYPDALFAADPRRRTRASLSGCRRASRARSRTHSDIGRQVRT